MEEQREQSTPCEGVRSGGGSVVSELSAPLSGWADVEKETGGRKSKEIRHRMDVQPRDSFSTQKVLSCSNTGSSGQKAPHSRDNSAAEGNDPTLVPARGQTSYLPNCHPPRFLFLFLKRMPGEVPHHFSDPVILTIIFNTKRTRLSPASGHTHSSCSLERGQMEERSG